MQVSLLDSVQTPLANKFYQAHKVRGRANKQDDIWVIKNANIVALCRVQNRKGNLFLSTLFVDPTYRNQGLANRLISKIRSQYDQVIYTFAYEDLEVFYRKFGFYVSTSLPDELAGMFNAYQQQNRKIIPMEYIGAN